jgi:hypothetical protein
VELDGAGDVRHATSGTDGRAVFTSVPAGAHVHAVAVVDNERLTSIEFEMPAAGGVRTILAAGVGVGTPVGGTATAAGESTAPNAPSAPSAPLDPLCSSCGALRTRRVNLPPYERFSCKALGRPRRYLGSRGRRRGDEVVVACRAEWPDAVVCEETRNFGLKGGTGARRSSSGPASRSSRPRERWRCECGAVSLTQLNVGRSSPAAISGNPESPP